MFEKELNILETAFLDKSNSDKVGRSEIFQDIIETIIPAIGELLKAIGFLD